MAKTSSIKTAGYSHMWEYLERKDGTTGFTPQEFQKIVRVAKSIIAAAEADGIEICGGFGNGRPRITPTEIWLNGKSPSQDHETFHLVQGGSDWTGCKTNRKPYDAVVVSILAAAKRIAPGAIRISSDGGSSAIKRVYSQQGVSPMSDSTLRSQLIRLAHQNPDLRSHLLPLLSLGKVARKWGERLVGPELERERRSYLPSDIRDQDPAPVPDGVDVQAWLFTGRSGFPTILAFVGNQSKPVIFGYYRKEADTQKALDDLIRDRRSRKEDKEKARQAPVEANPYKVGDILYSSWGYDQTNVDFYQVVKVGPSSVTIREIDSVPLRNSYVSAREDKFIGPPKNKILQLRGLKPGQYPSVRLTSFSHAHKWDGQPKYETPFNQGH